MSDITEAGTGVVDEQQQFFGGLSRHHLTVTKHRLLAERPRRLEDIGGMVGISRERVRQVAEAVRGKWVRTFLPVSSTNDVVRAIQDATKSIAPVPSVTHALPVLARTVPGIGTPLWRILAELHPDLEVEGEWMAVPNLDSAIRYTRGFAATKANVHGHVAVSALAVALDLDVNAAHVTYWLKRSGLRVCGDTVYSPQVPDAGAKIMPPSAKPSLKTRIAKVLEESATPMSARQLSQHLGDAQPNAIVSTMSVYDGFSRVDKNTWGLTSWGMPAFTSAHDLIATMLDKNGGRMSLDDLVTDLTSRFAITERTVRRCAALPPFGVGAGIVSHNKNRVATNHRRNPCPNLYRAKTGWRYFVHVNDNLLRGASLSITQSLAAIAGCPAGELVRLDSRLGEQIVRWTSRQPSCASIRRFLLHLGVTQGDVVFLHFPGDGTFDVTSADPTWRSGPPLSRVLALIGSPTENASGFGRALQTTADACDLQGDSDLPEIINQLRSRGGREVSELLKQAIDEAQRESTHRDKRENGWLAAKQGTHSCSMLRWSDTE